MEKELYQKGATLSACRKYRYALWRIWDPSKSIAMFICLNPSTADEETDDQTIRRCIGFAEEWQLGGFYMMNLFNFRATKPEDMHKHPHPVAEPGKESLADQRLKEAAEKCTKVIFAWGNEGAAGSRYHQVAKMFPDAWCFGTTIIGQPKHPLYLPLSAQLEKYNNDKSFIKKL